MRNRKWLNNAVALHCNATTLSQQEKTMTILNMFPVALAVAGLVLRWYVCTPAKQQSATPVAKSKAGKSVIKLVPRKQPAKGSRMPVPAKTALA
jgi:hypothetical protein